MGIAEVNGARLYFESWGEGDAGVLLVHGFTLDRRMWGAQVRELSKRWRVVAYDARGFGQSQVPGEGVYRHCDDMAGLCEGLGLKRVVAVGHSIGGHQTLEFALCRPDLVVGWAGVCVSGLASVPYPPDVMAMFKELRRVAGSEGVDAAKRIWGSCGWFASARESTEIARELDGMLRDYSGWHWLHVNPAENLVPAAAERLGELRAAVTVITGTRDLAYNEAVGDALERGIAGARRVRIGHAGHMANMEDPGAVNRALGELVERALGGR